MYTKHSWAPAMLLVVVMSACCQLRQGDLLFHVAHEANVITDVTPAMIDHVAICVNRDSVIEAISAGVVITPIADVRKREEGYYLVARVKGADRKRSVAHARRYIGRSYDYLYLPDNADIYCSELVQLSFVYKDGSPVFSTIPMSFHDSTGVVTKYWLEFYDRHQMSVPEGQPGTNPGEMSQRNVVVVKGKL